MSAPVVRVRASDPLPRAQLYLIDHGGVLSLIDAGTKGTAPRVLKAILAMGRKPEDLRQIVVSHGHGDHAGAAKALRDATGARIVVGAADGPVVTGEAPYPYPKAIVRPVYGHLANYDRFQPDVLVDGRTELDGGLVAIPAPGHTAGHIAILAPEIEALFVADAVWHLGPVRPSWGPFTSDPAQNAETVRRLAEERSEQLYFGHGPVVRRGGRERLRALTR